MVTVETKVQLALKEFLIEEINKYLKTKKNFDVVLKYNNKNNQSY